MEKMGVEQYLTDRLDDQINWYDGKSGWNQKWFKRLRLIEIAAAALIPFLSGYLSDPKNAAVISGLLGVLVAVAAATVSLFKFQENWIQYRTTAEQLRHERFLFLTGVAPYDKEGAFTMLVERVENLISRENSLWAQTGLQKTKKDEDAGAGEGAARG